MFKMSFFFLAHPVYASIQITQTISESLYRPYSWFITVCTAVCSNDLECSSLVPVSRHSTVPA